MRYFSVLLLILSACNPPTHLLQSRWNGKGERPVLEVSGLQSTGTLKSAGEQVEFYEQNIGDYPVENAYRKVIQRKKEAVFESFSVADPKKEKKIKKQADKLAEDPEASWALFLKSNPQYDDLKVEEPARVIIAKDHKGILKPLLCGQMRKKDGQLIELCLSQKLKLVRERILGSALDVHQAATLIFPKGPKYSDLVKVMVSRVPVSEGLKSNWVEVNTESSAKILENSPLEIQPQDERFDQTQAFFFTNQLFNWLVKNQILDTPLSLKITTQMGYPEKTNTAFYFGGRIRLGAGDDVIYSKMAWDPSIIMHEASHAAIEKLAHLSFEGEGGAINEGYADFFTSFLLNNPRMAENSYKPAGFRRSADAVVKMSEKNGGLYHDAAIVSGFFWALKSFLPDDRILFFAVRTLNRLGPNADFKSFKTALLEQKEDIFVGADLEKINLLLKERELE